MGYLILPINGENLVLKIKNINGIGFFLLIQYKI